MGFHPATPAEAVDSWTAMLFFRIAMFDPDLKRIGLGHAKHPTRGWVCVLDVLRGRGTNRVVVYPVDDQIDVPVLFPGTAIPDPIPESKTKRGGYPVTVTFQGQTVGPGATANLRDGEGREVEVWLSAPDKPAYQPNYQANTVCLIAREPLAATTAYTVNVTARVNGKAWKKTWRFK